MRRSSAPAFIIHPLTFLSILALFLSTVPGYPQTLLSPYPPTSVATGLGYKNITTDATTVVKSGVGVLHTVCVNTPAATETITIYDNTAASGTKIATITLFASTNPCFLFDVAFSTGLTVVTATAAGDITVSFI